MTRTSGKLFYKIGEVCELFAIEPHVLGHLPPSLLRSYGGHGGRLRFRRDFAAAPTLADPPEKILNLRTPPRISPVQRYTEK